MANTLTSSFWDTYNFIDYLNIEDLQCTNLPDGLKISTMCASAKRDKDSNTGGLSTDINLDNIYNYMKLNSDDILTIKKNDILKKTIIPEKKKKRRTTKKKK